MGFFEHMSEAIGNPMGVVSEKKKPIVTEKKTVPVKKQEPVFVQIMDHDMRDNFFSIGHADLFDFTNKFLNNEYGYTLGGVFGSSKKHMNEDRPDWFKVFATKAQPAKKSKTNFYIDMTDPMDTIKEVSSRMRVNYPDLIIGF